MNIRLSTKTHNIIWTGNTYFENHNHHHQKPRFDSDQQEYAQQGIQVPDSLVLWLFEATLEQPKAYHHQTLLHIQCKPYPLACWDYLSVIKYQHGQLLHFALIPDEWEQPERKQ